VRYPPAADDPSALLYPNLPHDEVGRLLASQQGVEEA